MKPATLVVLSGGTGPSKSSASGSNTIPPATNCQAVNTSTGAGRPQRLVSTVPQAIETATPKAAATPIRSMRSAGPSTSSATPPMLASAQAIVGGAGRSPNTG